MSSTRQSTYFKRLKLLSAATGILLVALSLLALGLWYTNQSTPLALSLVLLFLGALAPIAVKILSHTERNIKHERKSAEQSRQALITYVRVLSHEVRNPISGVLSNLQNLEKQLTTPQQLRELSRIEQAAQAASDVLQNIVTLNKGGPPEVSETRNTNLRETVEGCFRIVRFSNAGGIKLSYQVDDSVPENVVCDPLRLSQILLNLLGNAVKYTERGSVELAVSSIENNAKSLTQFKVTDEGPGISAADIDTLFLPYQQGSTEPAAGLASSGLGLSLVKKLVEEMQGEIRVESRLGVGSSFIVQLPLDVAVAERKQGLTDHAPVARGAKQPKVLVAEDNEINQLVAQRMLIKLGCNVTIAVNGAEACELHRDQTFDLILMDLQMPVLDGISATQAIIAEAKQAPHIVAMTANVLDEEKQKCIDAGMSDFLAKPVKLDNLRNCLRKHGLL